MIKKILIKNNIESFSEIKNVPRGTFIFEQKNKKILFCKNACDKKISDQEGGFDFKIILHDEKTENVPRGTFSYQVNKKVKSARICSTWNNLRDPFKHLKKKKLFHMEQFVVSEIL